MIARLIVAAAGCALLISGCSAKSDAPQESPSAPSPAAHGNLAECLSSHGVTDSGGPAAVLGPPAGVDQGTWDSAMKACSSFAPGPPGP